MTPVETTAVLGERIPSGTHGVRVGERMIFIEGEGLFETEAFRELSDPEIQQLTFVFPHLFEDMEDAYRREVESRNRGVEEPRKK